MNPSMISREVEARLKEVELFDVADRPVSAYSGGMRRRLSLAVSFIGKPKIWILDEPTLGMDPLNKRKA